MSRIVLKINLSACSVLQIPERVEIELSSSTPEDRVEIFEIVKMAVEKGLSVEMDYEPIEDTEEDTANEYVLLNKGQTI